MDDNAIIRQIREGDVEAYAILVRRHHHNLLAFIFRIVRDAHLAEDIGQEVFLNAYKGLSRFDTEQGPPFAAWLYILARNRSISELRKRGRTELLPPEEIQRFAGSGQAAETALIKREEQEALASSLALLPEPFRSTIMMSLDGASLEEIARRCDVPQATVKTRLFRAREKIKQALHKHFGGVGHERSI